ncbi:MAG: calcium-binding protein, partial [Bacteroidetes bacterium]|nr:calcium-binding protein [Bacteroidota bacterium]
MGTGIVATRSNIGDLLLGTEHKDIYWGAAGNDFLYGGKGDDELWGGSGNDLLNGGEGIDKAFYDLLSYENGIFVDFDPSDLTKEKPEITVTDSLGGIDTLISIERIVGTAKSDIVQFVNTINFSKLQSLHVDALNGTGGTKPIDILDFSAMTTGIYLQAAPEFITIADETGAPKYDDVKFINFEKIIGTSFADVVFSYLGPDTEMIINLGGHEEGDRIVPLLDHGSLFNSADDKFTLVDVSESIRDADADPELDYTITGGIPVKDRELGIIAQFDPLEAD